MSICLPNLRSTSVFKVYYGGTGQTSLTQGGVVIGNGIDAVQCITGSSDGQVLTWDGSLGTWIAKDSTGGSGGGGAVPDIVIAPSNQIPTKVYKKRISNKDYYSKYKIIDWSNTSNGSFRISQYDQTKKHVTIFNDSDQDLYVSVANDENPKIVIDFDNTDDLKNICVQYKYESASLIYTLFDYRYNDLINFHSYHTCSDDPASTKLGYGKNHSITTCGTSSMFSLDLTPDFYSEKLNQYNNSISDSGSYHIFLTSSSGQTVPAIFNISASADHHYKQYNIYTRVSSSTFISSSILFNEQYTIKNGFDLTDSLSDQENITPEEFSYIIYSQDSLTITDSEASLALFGYFLKPISNNKTLTVRVTETR